MTARAFLDTELKRSRQSRPASGRRSSSGKAEPRTVFPCCGGAEKGEDIRPPTHTLPLRAQEHSLPTAGLGELVSELSLHLLYPPCRLRDLNQGPPPPWVEGSEASPPCQHSASATAPALGVEGTHGRQKGKEGLGSVAHQGDRLGPCRGSPQPERRPPRGCGTDALSAVLTPAARSELSETGRCGWIQEEEASERELKLRTGAQEPGVGELASFGLQHLRPQGNVKLSKVWLPLGHRDGFRGRSAGKDWTVFSGGVVAAPQPGHLLRRNFSAAHGVAEPELRAFLRHYEAALAAGVRADALRPRWDFPGAFYFVGTVVSTIGFGLTTPATVGGKAFLIAYGLFGCAGTILFFNLFLERIISLLAFIMRACRERQLRRSGLLPATFRRGSALSEADCLAGWKPSVYHVLLILGLFAVLLSCCASAMYTSVEGWDYVDSLYFCFVTFSTIGFGDLVSSQHAAYRNQGLYRLGNFLFILLGVCCIYSLFNVISI
ncbi:PREDICTED: potassium channel subfamily K member 12, partial [Bison bison bison]|uniref:Potassium channel subfamily K member 12 n=1 Tax=Bison bison bison TaxID=43346 RepID=A0A6P3HCU1_BISBB